MTGEELKRIRIEANLTQYDLAKMAATTITTISQWENGRRPIPLLSANGLRAIITGTKRQEAR